MYIKRMNWLTVYGLRLFGPLKWPKLGWDKFGRISDFKWSFHIFTPYMTELINVTLLNNINL